MGWAPDALRTRKRVVRKLNYDLFNSGCAKSNGAKLPEGWETTMHGGKEYFFNREKKLSQWHRPGTTPPTSGHRATIKDAAESNVLKLLASLYRIHCTKYKSQIRLNLSYEAGYRAGN